MLAWCSKSWLGNKLFFFFILICLNFRLYQSLAKLTAKFLTQKSGSINRGTILALSPGRFRGDLHCLEQQGYRILRLDPYWLVRLPTVIFRLPIKPEILFQKSYTPEVEAAFEKLNFHLVPFLGALGRELCIDITLSAATHYAFDYLWGQALNKAGIPYVILHRECFKASDYQQQYWKEYWSRMRNYEAHSILVHNKACQEMFVNSGITTKERCHAFGALRMDDFAKKLKLQTDITPSPPTLLFFSFFPGVGLPNADIWRPDRFGFTKLFKHAHRAFFRFLYKNPDVNGILKLKWRGGDHEWENAIAECFLDEGLTHAQLDNLVITADGDSLDLLKSSTAVISFGSTTMLEAAVSGKPVIVPTFAEAAESVMEDKVLHFKNLNRFNCAHSEEEFETLMSRGIAGKLKIDKEGARKLFEDWIAPLDGEVASRHSAYFDTIISDSQKNFGYKNATF